MDWICLQKEHCTNVDLVRSIQTKHLQVLFTRSIMRRYASMDGEKFSDHTCISSGVVSCVGEHILIMGETCQVIEVFTKKAKRFTKQTPQKRASSIQRTRPRRSAVQGWVAHKAEISGEQPIQTPAKETSIYRSSHDLIQSARFRCGERPMSVSLPLYHHARLDELDGDGANVCHVTSHQNGWLKLDLPSSLR